nr:hypothetical protein [uncultured Mucilaginibacter sp.]
MTKLSRYTNFDELKASKNTDKPVPVGRGIKPSELEELFLLLRNNLVTEQPGSIETIPHEE